MDDRPHRPTPAFESALIGMIENAGMRETLRQFAACAVWPEATGSKIAAVSKAETIRSGVMFVSVKSSAWANELSYCKPDIISKINKILGRQVVFDIHFKVASSGTFRKEQPPEKIDPPTDEALKDFSASGALALSPSPGAADQSMSEHIRLVTERVAKVMEWKKANGWLPCSICEALCDPKDRSKDGVCPVCSARRRSR
jgi:hypothetical protein